MYILHFMQFLVYSAFNQILGKAAEEENGKRRKYHKCNFFFFLISDNVNIIFNIILSTQVIKSIIVDNVLQMSNKH